MAVAARNINNLPDEVLLEILSHLPVEDLALSAPFVCSRWSQLCRADFLWKNSSFSDVAYLSDDYVLSVLQNAPKLKRFQVTSQRSAKILEKLSECCKELDEFVILWAYKCTEAVANVLRQCKKLKTLKIPGYALENEELAALMAQLTDLRAIYLTNSSIGPVALKDISDGCPSLQYLDLHRSPWVYTDMKYFLEQKRNKLVYFATTHLSVEGTYVYPLLTVCGTALRTLKLTYGQSQPVHIDPLTSSVLSSITTLSGLKSLTIQIPSTEDVLVDIFEGEAMSQLLELEIHENLEVKGTLINVVCSNCPNLSRLVIVGCWNLTDDGLKYLYKCAHLEQLVLSRCDSLTDAAMKHVAKCTKLRSLRLVLSRFVHNGLSYLLELSELRDLCLIACIIPGLPLKLFHLYLKKLRTLTVQECSYFDKVALNNLKKEMPYLCITL